MLWLILPLPLLAASSSNHLSVSATVVNVCAVSATVLAFGAVPAQSASATATVTLTCTKGASATVGLNAGLYSAYASHKTTRAMKDAGKDYLPYEIYKDSAYTTVWGNTGSGTQTTTGTGSPQAFTAYGQVPGGHGGAISSNYADTVTITVTY